jgi:hypothetical protein
MKIDPVQAYLKLTGYPKKFPKRIPETKHIIETPINNRFFKGPNGQTYPSRPQEEHLGNHIDIYI